MLNLIYRKIKGWIYRRKREKTFKKKIRELNKRDNLTYKH